MRAPHFRFVACWYDLWVGAYWSGSESTLYFLPLPCLGVALTFGVGAPAARMRALAKVVRREIDEIGATAGGQFAP